MEFNHFVGIVRRWWITLLFAVLVGALAGYTIAEATPPSYESTSRILVGPLNTDRNIQEAGGRLAETYAEMAGTNPVIQAALARLSDDTGFIDPRVEATADDVTRIVTLRVRARTATGASTLANSVAIELQELVDGGGVRPEGQVQIVELAQTPNDPVAPNVSLIVTLSVLTALILAVGLALLFEHLIDAVQQPDELLDATGASFAAALSPRTRLGPGRKGTGLVATDPNAPAAADLRVIATNLELSLPEGARTVLVAGVDERSGSAAVAANLATVIAEAGRTVLLVDFTDDGASLVAFPEVTDETLQRAGGRPIAISDGSLSLVAKGAVPVMEEAHARALLEDPGTSAERVLLHVPHLPANADGLVWSRVADATVVVAQRASARRAVVEAVADQLRWAGANIVGAVLSERTWETQRRPFGESVRRALSATRGRRTRGTQAGDAPAQASEPVYGAYRGEGLVPQTPGSPDASSSKS